MSHPVTDDASSGPREGDFLITPDEKVPEALGPESAPRVLLEAEPVAAAGFLDLPTDDELLRGSIAPWRLVAAGPPPLIEPASQQGPRSIDVADVVIALRACVDLVRLAPPR